MLRMVARLSLRARTIPARSPFTSHRDRAAFFLQPLHDSRFLLGKNFSFELVDSQLPSNVFGSCVAVAREHQQSQPFAFQITNRLWRGWLNWVSNAEQSGNPPIY